MLHAKKFLSPLHAGVQLPPVSALQFVGSTTTAVTKSESKCDQAQVPGRVRRGQEDRTERTLTTPYIMIP